MASTFYTEGVGHGGFVGTFSATGSVIVESFSKSLTSNVILQTDQYGAPLKQAAVTGWDTGSMVVQLPMSGANPIEIQRGETVTVPTDHGGSQWFVADVSPTYHAGEYHKATLSVRRVTGT